MTIVRPPFQLQDRADPNIQPGSVLGAQLKQQIAGLTGQDLAQQPDVAEKLSRACQTLKNHILNPENVSALTGRLKRRVVLD